MSMVEDIKEDNITWNEFSNDSSIFSEFVNSIVTTWTEISSRDVSSGWGFSWGLPWGDGAMFEEKNTVNATWIEQ